MFNQDGGMCLIRVADKACLRNIPENHTPTTTHTGDLATRRKAAASVGAGKEEAGALGSMTTRSAGDLAAR